MNFCFLQTSELTQNLNLQLIKNYENTFCITEEMSVKF